MHIASLEAPTTLNTYNLWKLAELLLLIFDSNPNILGSSELNLPNNDECNSNENEKESCVNPGTTPLRLISTRRIRSRESKFFVAEHAQF